MSSTWAEGMSPTDLTAFNEEIEKSLKVYDEAFQKAQADNKILLLHDHPFSAAESQRVLGLIKDKVDPGNSDLFAPQLLEILLKKGTTPILTIRDPRLAVPSAFRVLGEFGLPHGSGRPNFFVSTSTLWTRWLYNSFTSHGIQPVVVDGDDIMAGGEAFTRLLAERLDLDPEAMLLSWEAPYDHVLNSGHLSKEEYEGLHPMYYKSQSVLIESSKPDAGRAARNVDLKKEEQSWEADFEEEDAKLMREAVERAMPQYQWLWERRLKRSDMQY